MQDTKIAIMPDWYVALREKAAVDFATLSDPSFKYGLQIFFPPKTIALPETISETDAASPVKVPRGVEMMTFIEACADERYEGLLRGILEAQTGDKLDAWRDASVSESVFVRVSEGFQAQENIRINLSLTAAQNTEHIVILAEPGSRVTVVEHLSSSGAEAKTRGAKTDIVVRPGARVTHVSVQDFGSEVTCFDEKRAVVEKDGSMTWIDCAFGGDYVRSRIATSLVGEGADVRVMSMCFADDAGRFDIRHDVQHLASRTTSDIRTKNALCGHSKAIYRGLVRIDASARGCTGRQKEDTLLLSPDAEIDAMPDLEIGTGDVRAGHSASIGGVDKEKLFYLMSRGLSRTDATRTLIEGFFAPVVADMRDSGLEDMVNCLIAARMEKTTTAGSETN